MARADEAAEDARRAWTERLERRAAGGVSSRSAGRSTAAESGLWAIRYRDALGRRPQQTGYRTKGEAREALDEELRRVRLGPAVPAAGDAAPADDAYVKQYDAAPSTVAFLVDNMRPALEAFGDRADRRCCGWTGSRAWRASLPEGKRYRAHAVRCGRCWRRRCAGSGSRTTRRRWSRTRSPSRARSIRSSRWEEIDAIADELDEVRGAAGGLPGRHRACGRRRRSARSGATSSSSGACS